MNDYTYEYQECFIEVEGVERRLNVVKFNVWTLPTSVKDGCLLYQVYYIQYILYAIHWKLIHVPIVWSWNAIIAIHTPVNNHILLINMIPLANIRLQLNYTIQLYHIIYMYTICYLSVSGAYLWKGQHWPSINFWLIIECHSRKRLSLSILFWLV